MTHALIVTIL